MRVLSGNGIPNHAVGTFPNAANPNSISAQNVNQSFSITPSVISQTGAAIGGGANAPAYALNSVTFDPATAGTCTDAGACTMAAGSGNWNIEALGHDTFDFGADMNHAHVQPDGTYHYHGMPENLMTKLSQGEAMTLVGWAVDGFPVYARYGYTDTNDASSAIKILSSSWRLKTTADPGRPTTITSIQGPDQSSVGNTIAMGAFTQDYEFVEGLGDLDQCNGRTGVTPEFPNGIYFYVVTDTFPYFPRCLKGDF